MSIENGKQVIKNIGKNVLIVEKKYQEQENHIHMKMENVQNAE